MPHYEAPGKSDEWYTPKYVFDALGCEFYMDVACPEDRTYVSTPAIKFLTSGSLETGWEGFVWMNPPFGKDKMQWIQKIIDHKNGIALLPDRSSSTWWQYAASHSECILQVNTRIRFIAPDSSRGNNISGVGTTLFAFGEEAVQTLLNGQKKGLGILFRKITALSTGN